MEGQGVRTSHATVAVRSTLVASLWFVGLAIALATFFVLPSGGSGRFSQG